jgi:predicted O-methyltransferase YrrM
VIVDRLVREKDGPMQFEHIYEKVGAHALMSRWKAQKLYEFVLREKPKKIYEMGTHRGGSALVMAAALHELGVGKVTTFDFRSVRALRPNVETLARKSGLKRHIGVNYCDWCFEWELGKLLEKKRERSIDFVYIDGGHYWNCTALTFYLVTEVLRRGGWILFDDLDWLIDKHESKDNSYAKRISLDARRRPMVQMVFDLLVRTSDRYHNFRVSANGSWGWAQKKQ